VNIDKISNDKKNKIINTSLKLFSKNGYKHTTTDAITKDSNISKGILFHYFTTKKTLYFFLYDYSLKFIMDQLKNEKTITKVDFFDYIKKQIKRKWLIMEKHPYIYAFLVSAIKEEDKEIKEYIRKKQSTTRNDSWNEVLLKTDRSKFKNEDDLEKLVKLIVFYSDGLMKDFIETENIDVEKSSQEFMDILSMLKRNFYKEEV